MFRLTGSLILIKQILIYAVLICLANTADLKVTGPNCTANTQDDTISNYFSPFAFDPFRVSAAPGWALVYTDFNLSIDVWV